MFIFFQNHHDYTIVVASLCGALVWIMSQHYLDRKRQPFYFTVSFIMGLIGADVTLEVIKTMIPGFLADNRAVGAFFCSALIITLITKLMAKMNTYENKINK